MTARRPSAFRDRMARPTSAAPPQPTAAEPTAPTTASTAEPLSKFTVLLDGDEAAAFDQLALNVRRLLGRRVAKGDLVRALVALAGDDATIRDQVVEELRARPSRRSNGTTA